MTTTTPKALKMPTYSGTKGEDLDAWLIQAQLRYTSYGCDSDDKKVRLLLQALKGKALNWVTPYLIQYKDKLVKDGDATHWLNTLNDFEEFLRTMSGETMARGKEALMEISRLRMATEITFETISQYVLGFRGYLVNLPDDMKASEEFKTYAFQVGLSEKLKEQIILQPGSDQFKFEDWAEKAMNIGKSLRMVQKQKKKNFIQPYRAVKDPDAMDVDALGMRQNTRGGSYGRSAGHGCWPVMGAKDEFCMERMGKSVWFC